MEDGVCAWAAGPAQETIARQPETKSTNFREALGSFIGKCPFTLRRQSAPRGGQLQTLVLVQGAVGVNRQGCAYGAASRPPTPALGKQTHCHRPSDCGTIRQPPPQLLSTYA